MRKHPGNALPKVISLDVAGLFILFGFIFSSKENVILSVASPSQICVQADADTLQQVWMKPTKIIKVLEHVVCEEPSENCFAKSQEKARDGGELIAVCNSSEHTEHGTRPLSTVH